MTDLINRIADAIMRQEGMGPDHFNPTNLRAAPWLTNPVIVKGFWNPTSRAQGVAGAIHVIALHIARGESLRQLITSWAPASDGNKPDLYIGNVMNWASIPDSEVPLYSYLLEQPKIPT